MSDFSLARCALRRRRGPMLPLTVTYWSARPCTSTLATDVGLRYQVFLNICLFFYFVIHFSLKTLTNCGRLHDIAAIAAAAGSAPVKTSNGVTIHIFSAKIKILHIFCQNTNTGSCFHTAPAAGIYRLCFHARFLIKLLHIMTHLIMYSHSRFRQGGNAGDVTVQAGGTTYAAAFGDGDERDWRSTGQCFYQVRNTYITKIKFLNQ